MCVCFPFMFFRPVRATDRPRSNLFHSPNNNPLPTQIDPAASLFVITHMQGGDDACLGGIGGATTWMEQEACTAWAEVGAEMMTAAAVAGKQQAEEGMVLADPVFLPRIPGALVVEVGGSSIFSVRLRVRACLYAVVLSLPIHNNQVMCVIDLSVSVSHTPTHPHPHQSHR